MDKRGFTMVEVIISIVILSAAILALSSTTASLVQATVTARDEALANQACEDRLARIRLHPVYTQLDSVYSETGTPIAGLDGYTRSTEITRIIQPGDPAGKYIDYTRVTVTVDGPGLDEPVARTITLGAS